MKVLVITAGGFHLGYAGCYGNEWIATPALDRLATEGVVFDQHYADCPNAAGARRAWRTGHYHFPFPECGEGVASQSVADLLQLLRSGSIVTSLVIDGSQTVPADFAAGWEWVEQVPPVADEGTPLERTLDAACRALDRLTEYDRWLLWVDLNTLLPPWDVPEQFGLRYFQQDGVEDEDENEAIEDEDLLTPLIDPRPGFLDPRDDTTFLRLQRSYAAAITYLDSGLELLFAELRQRALLDDLLLFVTTDRGAALGEHRMLGEHRPWLYEELIHLPLIVRLPGGAEAGRRVAALTQPVDLLPTLLEAFQLPLPAVHGRSLLPLIRGEAEQVRPYACSGLQVGTAVELALRTPAWGFLLPMYSEPDDPPRAAQLYVKPDDRWEVNNVLQHHLELAEHLEQTLRGFVVATSQRGPLQPPQLRDVEAEPAQAQPDPNSNPLLGGNQP